MSIERHQTIFMDNPEVLVGILADAGCTRIRYDKGQVRCAPPGSKDPNKAWINPLGSGVVFDAGEKITGGIYELIGYFLTGETKQNEEGKEFVEERTKNIELKEYEGVDFFVFYNEIKEREEKIKALQHQDDEEYDEERVIKHEFKTYMKRYVFGNVQHLLDEGIRTRIANRYRIHHDPYKNRVLFPYTSPDDKDTLIGLQGRTMYDKEYRERFNVAKVLNYIDGFVKKWTFFGIAENIEDINKHKCMIIFEGEKSPLKLSLKKHVGVACGGSVISNVQIELINKMTDKDVEIILAFDKDVTEDKLIEICRRIAPYRKVSYIYDDFNLLGEKDSPIDLGFEVFGKLMKMRKKIN